MTILPHLLLTTVGVQAFGLKGEDIVLAYAFGYGIDLVDHPIKLPLYLRKNGKKNEKHYHWRTPLQEPVALMWIVPLSLYLGTWVPAVFFISHFALDYMVSYEKRPFYPFSTYTTEGILRKYSDTTKEILVCVLCTVVSVALFMTKSSILFHI
ncbi:MAG TPA: hypothetical protein VGR15_02535 [Bacteroidota bacterium]|jgi:membrane-bound metal-dependent hydrolase YbcI (DUF457 family)|nr:hypothetical protein [Bacteroidota bacterium]